MAVRKLVDGLKWVTRQQDNGNVFITSILAT